MAKAQTQAPIYKREFCLEKEGANIFSHTVVHAHRPISDDELRMKAVWAAQECEQLYGGRWIAHAGMTSKQMAIKRCEPYRLTRQGY